MDFDFIEHRESENIIPMKIGNKEKIHADLMNLHQSWTGRLDVMFSNDFFREAIQLIINSMALFEKGYFDCAFYSLRQSLEISTTVVYFVDDSEDSRSLELKRWKSQDRFPMHKEMLTELEKRKNVFAELKEKMSVYFDEIEQTKRKLNKYVHKQGFDKFYVSRSRISQREKWEEKITSDFTTYLAKSIGAVAVLRLAIDPLPVLLNDEDIYNRTTQFLTEGYSDDFIETYIGIEHISCYKETGLYRTVYNGFIGQEEMLPPVLDIVKHEYVDKTKIHEIKSQKHLLSNDDLVAIELIIYSDKVAKVYPHGGLSWYFTNTPTNRTNMKWSSTDFDISRKGAIRYNANYDEAFLSYFKVFEEDYYVEHNEKFTDIEIKELENICNLLTNAFSEKFSQEMSSADEVSGV